MSTTLQKTNCAYHTNGVLYGIVGVLIAHFAVSSITPYYLQCRSNSVPHMTLNLSDLFCKTLPVHHAQQVMKFRNIFEGCFILFIGGSGDNPLGVIMWPRNLIIVLPNSQFSVFIQSCASWLNMPKACLRVFVMFSLGAVISEYITISSIRHNTYIRRPLRLLFICF